MGRFEWGCVRWRRFGCGWPMSGWRSRLLDSAGGGGIWRGRELRDGGRRCQRWFGELLPVSFVRIDRGGAGMMGGRRKLTRFSSMAGLSAPSMSF